MAQRLVDSITSSPEAGYEPITTTQPQWLHRAITRIEGVVAGVAAGALAATERLAVAVQCDGRQAEELRLARLALSRVITDDGSARNWARVALAHLGRADTYDRHRDEHVGIAATLVTGIRRAASLLGGLCERLLTGRQRPAEQEGVV